MSKPGKVMPGGRIVAQSGEICSAGWIVEKNGKQYVSTAAHCGEVGKRFGFTDSSNRWHEFGFVAERVYENGHDRALIEITDSTHVDPNIPISNYTYVRKMSSDEVASTRPTLCVLGQTSGLSCGPFYSRDSVGRINFTAVATYGDSGGSVFALVGEGLYPVGTLQGGYSGGKVLAAQPLEGPLYEGVTLVQ